MDQFLRSRKLNSASGRKKRAEEQLAAERRIQHRRNLDDDIFERADTHISESGSRPRGQRNGSVQTPRKPTVTILNAFATEDMVPETPVDCHAPASIGPPSPLPQMLPSLAAPSDWKYDRYSVVMAEFSLPTPASQPTFSPNATFTPHFAPSPQFAGSLYDDSNSLLETAQPVSYHLPKVRPSVISIASRGSSKEWKTLPSERELMVGSPVTRPPTRLQRRESATSVHSGFQACEAQLMEVPDMPDNALYMMSNPSADSLPMSRAKYSVARNADARANTVRKPSHGRMSSIKNIIKSPALSRAPSLHVQHRQSSAGRPSTAVADILDDNYNPFETVPADLNEPPARTSWSTRQLIADQRTPTGPSPHESGRASSSFEVGDDKDEDSGEDAADDVTLEDEDFEARISRQSPASTASDGASGPPSSPVALQRIRSLPMSSPPPPKNSGSGHPRPQLLTSLLRPPSLLNRSTTSTRATTPDSSDVETPLDTEAAVAQSARRAHPLPPTSPKVPTYEYYGFVLYLASSLAFLMYILWSYLPSPFLHALGITYYPNRWWSLAIPAWIVMLLVYIYIALLSYNVEYLTLPLNSTECMVDEAGNVAILDLSGRIRKGGSARFVEVLAQQQKKTKKKHMDEERHHNKNSSGSWGKSSSSSV
ncbi:hypothetical protein DV737_g5421, partial [Chaetothyriales sp. CBS 132003]